MTGKYGPRRLPLGLARGCPYGCGTAQEAGDAKGSRWCAADGSAGGGCHPGTCTEVGGHAAHHLARRGPRRHALLQPASHRHRDSAIRSGIRSVYRDPETFQIKPLLAESFKWADETTLEFTLRKNVTFHNGDKLTADDVVYTINSILTDKQVSTPSNYAYHRSRDQGGRYACPRGAEARVPRGTRLHGDDALHHAEGLSREGRAAGILAASDRRGSVQDHQDERRYRSRYGALRRLLLRQPKGEAGDQQDHDA